MNNIGLQNCDNCYNCEACIALCPKNAISLTEDGYGFIIPKIETNKCIDCGICKEACNSMKRCEKRIPQSAYLAQNKNDVIVASSSSGGAFSGIIEALLQINMDLIVYGVAWTKDGLSHIRCQNGQTGELQKSKYVESSGHMFREVRNDLEQKHSVLYSGTPCQISGLIIYLKNTNVCMDKLTTVDIVCHGVPSYKMFEKYTDEQGRMKNSKIISYIFRNKKYHFGGRIDSRTALRTFENGKKDVVNYSFDPFLRMYYSRLGYRGMCYKCSFAGPKRVSDITIGDFWGDAKKYVSWDTEKGLSTLLINTSKGVKLIDNLRSFMKMQEIEYQIACNCNDALIKPTVRHNKQDEFLRLIQTNIGFKQSVYKVLPPKNQFLIFGRNLVQDILYILRRRY